MDKYVKALTRTGSSAPLRVGVIGCGYWGPNILRNLDHLGEVDLVAAADRLPDRRQFLRDHYPRINVHADHLDLLDGPAEAVVIATPAHTHYKLALEALSAGKHVLVEKPLTTSVAEAMDLVHLADERGLVLMVGHTFLFNPAVVELRRLVASNELGTIYHADSARLNLGLLRPQLDVIWDLAPHDISILLYVLDKLPLAVTARGQACFRPDLPEVGRIDLEFEGGVTAHIHVSWLSPVKVRRTTVVGHKKMVVYDDVSDEEKIRIYDKGLIVGDGSESSELDVTYRYGDLRIPHIKWQEPLRLECEHFVSCIRGGTEPRGSGQLGMMVVAVLEAADRSRQSGGAVSLMDLVAELTDNTELDLRDGAFVDDLDLVETPGAQARWR